LVPLRGPLPPVFRLVFDLSAVVWVVRYCDKRFNERMGLEKFKFCLAALMSFVALSTAAQELGLPIKPDATISPSVIEPETVAPPKEIPKKLPTKKTATQTKTQSVEQKAAETRSEKVSETKSETLGDSRAEKPVEPKTEKAAEPKAEKLAEPKAERPVEKPAKQIEKPRKKYLMGVDLGLSADFLFSDPKTGAFGAGLGHHYGMNANIFADHVTGLKIRLERVNFEETLIGEKSTESLLADSKLKWAQQQYWIFSLGAEWRSEGFFGRQFFAEALLGYGVGQPSQYVLINKNSNELSPAYLNTENAFFVSFGGGFRREFRENWNILFSLRTTVPLKTVYAGPWSEQLFIPVPLMFSAGFERAF
jgi:hypothetical protein